MQALMNLRGSRAFAAAIAIIQGTVMTAGCLVLAGCPSSDVTVQGRKIDHVAPHDPPAPPRKLWLVQEDGSLQEVPDVAVIPIPEPAGPEPTVDGVEEL